jgi:hypothetical protein
MTAALALSARSNTPNNVVKLSEMAQNTQYGKILTVNGTPSAQEPHRKENIMKIFLILAVLYSIVSTMDYNDEIQKEQFVNSKGDLVPCTTDYECEFLNPNVKEI